MNKRIAIYGGSFSPPHLGHAGVIELLVRFFPCQEIWVMPSSDREDKTMTAEGTRRMKMLEIMFSELFPNPRIPLILSPLELAQDKPTITYETKLELEKQYPELEFHFVIGQDILNDIETTWIKGKELFESANFIIMKKPYLELPSNLPPNSTIIESDAWLNLSSTFVRQLVKAGYSGIPYITQGVYEYIQKNNLYLL